MASRGRLGVERRFLDRLLASRHLGIDLGDGIVVHARPEDFQRPFGGVQAAEWRVIMNVSIPAPTARLQ